MVIITASKKASKKGDKKQTQRSPGAGTATTKDNEKARRPADAREQCECGRENSRDDK